MTIGEVFALARAAGKLAVGTHEFAMVDNIGHLLIVTRIHQSGVVEAGLACKQPIASMGGLKVAPVLTCMLCQIR